MATTIDYSFTEYYKEGIKTFSAYMAPLNKISNLIANGVEGSAVRVPIVDANAQDWDSSTGFVPSGSMTYVDVPLEQVHSTVAIPNFTFGENPAASLGAASAFYNKQLEALGVKVLQKIFSGSAAFTNSVSVSGSTFGLADVRTAKAALDVTFAPLTGRVLITQGVFSTGVTPKTSDTVVIKPSDYGFEHYQSVLPTSIGALALSPIGYASVLSMPVVGNNSLGSAKFTPISIGNTGITVMHKTFRDEKLDVEYSSFYIKCGGKVGLQSAGYKILNAG